MKSNLKSQLHLLGRIPNQKFWIEDLQLSEKSTVVFYDKKLKDSQFVQSLRKVFSEQIPVNGGEKIKQFGEIEKMASRVTQFKDLTLNVEDLCFISVGGGTVGDAVGFLSAIFKRGVRWVNVPTTWLSSVDSAHGGKTAINLKGIKNQLGQFYAPSDVVINKQILWQQPPALTQAALGEVAKAVLLDQKSFSKALSSGEKWSDETIWRELPTLIKVKMNIVDKDPFEKKKLRYLLNWGHSFGHVFESCTGKPHGKCVGQGLVYEAFLSNFVGKLSEKGLNELLEILNSQFSIRPELWTKNISKNKFISLMKNDKKAKANSTVSVVLVHDSNRYSVVPLAIESLWMSYRAFQAEYFE